MAQLKKIAILQGSDSTLTFEIDELSSVFLTLGIETKLFYESDSILAYCPDCVLVTSPQDAKLTPFPTYGFINRPRDEYLELPRFLRNILTYDGYLTFSPRLAEMLRDLTFGARKLGSSILTMGFFPRATTFAIPRLEEEQKIVIFDPDFDRSRFKTATYTLLEKIPNSHVVTFSINQVEKYHRRFIAVSNLDELNETLKKYNVGICLNSGDQQEEIMNSVALKFAALGMVAIVHHTKLLASYFGDNFYYLPEDVSVSTLPTLVKNHLADIKVNPQLALRRAQAAHELFVDKLSIDNFVQEFIRFHAETLVNKGYVPHPDVTKEKALPSVTYIMRTGGKHRPHLERALDCLVNQQYPDLRVIFVTHVKVPFIDEIIAKYPSLKCKVIESIKSRRSEAIRDGMAAVETDLFGLFDDDDELFPNHVRMLVKTMQYHNHRDWRGEIGMVYSGSIHADDTYPVLERVEFHDHKLIGKNEKRAIEHFRFYSASLMSQHAWFMPNGWLARASLIDEELLVDPALDTCEDLYFELQIAQRRHFAFSAEVTAIHHFHHLGNSTIDDSHKHLPDTQRIALRNFSRTFAPDMIYDTHYNIVGRVSCHDLNQILYQDYVSEENRGEYRNQFYPNRYQAPVLGACASVVVNNASSFFTTWLFLKNIACIRKVIFMDGYRRKYYWGKLTESIKQYGVRVTLGRMASFLSRQSSHGTGAFFYVPTKHNKRGFLMRMLIRIRLFFSNLSIKRGDA